MSIYIIGAGSGAFDLYPSRAARLLTGCRLVIGARRLLDELPPEVTAERVAAILPEEIASRALSCEGDCCILMSGDCGFYSGAAKLTALLKEYTVIPGVSSPAMLSARLGIPWQDWRLVSAHGRDCDVLGEVSRHRETFFLTGGQLSAAGVCGLLTDAGMGALCTTAGERLGLLGERITRATAEELSKASLDPLTVLLVENPHPLNPVKFGLPDDSFIRGRTPMTKSEVRAVILSKLRLNCSDVVWDVGAGTGSVSIECAMLCRTGRVYAVEQSDEGCGLIAQNAAAMGVSNLEIIHGRAPQALDDLPAPDAVFIGGSSGGLDEIVRHVLAQNPLSRIVISAITLETLCEAASLFDRLGLLDTEVVQVSVSRTKRAGSYNLLMAQNPVFIISGVGNGQHS